MALKNLPRTGKTIIKMERNPQKAFHWIVGILKNHGVPFEIEGGLAARAYGSERELADIDLVIPEKSFAEIVSDVKDYIVSGPEQLKDKHWDLLFLALDYEGQAIEIVGAYEQKYFDKITGEWVHAPSDFSKSEMHPVFGLVVPIVPKENLILAKKRLGREVDFVDLEFLEKQN